MQRPPTITFRGMRATDGLKALVSERVAKLETYAPSLTGCHVIVQQSERRHKAGNRYRVHIDLTLPGGEILVSHDAASVPRIGDDRKRATRKDEVDPERKHAGVAIRAAFDVARRRLQDFARRQRGA